MARVRLGRFPSIEGELARLALEQESISVELLGGQRSVLQGVAPPSETMVELWVEADELERAQRLLSTVLVENARATGELRCPACGLTSPSNFSVCWSCQAALENALKVAPAPVDPPRARPPVFAVLFAITSLTLGVLLWHERQQPKVRDSPTSAWRWTPTGCLEQTVREHVLSRSCDRDFDGNFEEVDAFDRNGRLISSAYDANEDGVVERVDSFDQKGELVRRDFDLDDDWRFERNDEFNRAGRLWLRWSDLDADGRSDRQDQYDERGVLSQFAERIDGPTPQYTRLLPGRRLVFSAFASGERIAELSITTDAGVVRHQVLTAAGWDDENGK